MFPKPSPLITRAWQLEGIENTNSEGIEDTNSEGMEDINSAQNIENTNFVQLLVNLSQELKMVQYELYTWFWCLEVSNLVPWLDLGVGPQMWAQLKAPLQYCTVGFEDAP